MRKVIYILSVFFCCLWYVPQGWGQIDTLIPIPKEKAKSKYSRIGVEVLSLKDAFIDFAEFLIAETDSTKVVICVWPEGFAAISKSAEYLLGKRSGMLEEVFLEHQETFKFINDEKMASYIFSALDSLKNNAEKDKGTNLDSECLLLNFQEAYNEIEFKIGNVDISRYTKSISAIQTRKIALGCNKAMIYHRDVFSLLFKIIHHNHQIDYFLLIEAWRPDEEVETFGEPTNLELRIKALNKDMETANSINGNALLKSYCLVKQKKKKNKKGLKEPPLTFNQLKYKADELFASKKYVEALLIYENIIVKYLSNAEVNYCMGICYYQTKKYTNAIEYLDRAKRLGGKKVESLSLISLIHIKTSDFKSARKSLSEFNALMPKNAIFHKHSALFYSSRRNYKKTYYHLKEAIVLGMNEWLWIEKEPILKGFRERSKYYEKILYLK